MTDRSRFGSLFYLDESQRQSETLVVGGIVWELYSNCSKPLELNLNETVITK